MGEEIRGWAYTPPEAPPEAPREPDTMHERLAQIGTMRDARGRQSVKIWDVPATQRTGTAYIVQVDQHAAYWTIYSGDAAVARGQGSVALQNALRELRVTQ